MTNSNTTLIFECLTLGYPSPSYQWQHLNEIVSHNSTIQINNFNDTFIGTYICQVENIVGKLFAEAQTSEHCKLNQLKHFITFRKFADNNSFSLMYFYNFHTMKVIIMA